MFSILTNKLRSLSGHTAVLEACDWDEDLMDQSFVDLELMLKEYSGISIDSLNNHVRKGMRKKKYDDAIIRSLLELIRVEVESEITTIRGEA